MDLIDRLHRRLLAALPAAAEADSALEVTIADVYQRLIPYRSVRGDLGVMELAEYENALLRLLAGERDYVDLADAAIRLELQRELASVNPILGIYRDYADAKLRLDRGEAAAVRGSDKPDSATQAPAHSPPAESAPAESAPVTPTKRQREASARQTARVVSEIFPHRVKRPPLRTHPCSVRPWSRLQSLCPRRSRWSRPKPVGAADACYPTFPISSIVRIAASPRAPCPVVAVPPGSSQIGASASAAARAETPLKSARLPVVQSGSPPLGPLLLLLVSIVGCERGASPDEPGEQVAAAVEEIDPAILASLPAGVSTDMVEEGRKLFVTCSVCHGLQGEGTPLAPSLRGPTWIHITGTTAEIGQIIRDGVPTPARYPIPMPVMGGGKFDDAQIQALANYVQLLGKQPASP